ncbi:hypothetical protein PR202_gn00736 [Eleusine coracana subsp. coracana]|uniref:Uncharacterized protein n=1 Tax=Eleusine coracana subsp. coracana TaxID=191504 RepID=A0AAV5G0A1_ELECO|nr:hypothetical protein QOZ80_6BG0470140 [Eleusine coracana subsp. coracana]GJN41369.1 hypothetical protein PR202_gn00736 [Eleusine coracana subsp. coracana]
MEAPAWFLSFAPIGALYVTTLCLRLLSYLALCLRRPKDLRRSYGSWAVITGPTSGLGRSMARELAGLGLNLVLVGRDPAKLRVLSDAITRSHGIETKTVVFDLSLVSTAQGDEAMQRLREAVDGLDVGVLVNNAAVAKPGAMFLHEAGVEPLMRIVRVNLLALTQVTAAVLPGMVARGRGAVVNIGSGSSLALPSFPLFSVYVATKRYVAAFSRSLYAEYKSKGIDVQCQAPFLLNTNMISSAVRGSFFPVFVVTPDACARAAVRWIGHGGPLCVPNIAHRFQWWISGFAPEVLLDAYRLAQHLQQRAVFSFLRERPEGRGKKQVQENGLTSYHC